MDAKIQLIESKVAAKDPDTVVHQWRVAHISWAIAREMGLPEKQIDTLQVAATIHDVGKISIPMDILSKRGRLSEPEWAEIKKHPTTGWEWLKPFKLPTGITQIILQHHERLNGSGYPFGLSGDEILLEARILGVADVIDAIAFHRPYKPSLGIRKAVDELRQHQGSLYDPSVVHAFMRLYSGNMFGNFFGSQSFCYAESPFVGLPMHWPEGGRGRNFIISGGQREISGELSRTILLNCSGLNTHNAEQAFGPPG
jgi:putative two-component system response regulator